MDEIIKITYDNGNRKKIMKGFLEKMTKEEIIEKILQNEERVLKEFFENEIKPLN